MASLFMEALQSQLRQGKAKSCTNILAKEVEVARRGVLQARVARLLLELEAVILEQGSEGERLLSKEDDEQKCERGR